ncbi:Hypothetical_protein [Hexamita inflata]|uniref:Hypothetical_protein n=1 Tax=Hexamita inflata TaxID=28002 RepID=A0AA86NMP7_9EUKA|nr:Hypothetical protein HINF_LOCUS9958 [Hexamita inflata]
MIQPSLKYEERIQLPVSTTSPRKYLNNSVRVEKLQNLASFSPSKPQNWDSTIPYELKTHKNLEKQQIYLDAVEQFKQTHPDYIKQHIEKFSCKYSPKAEPEIFNQLLDELKINQKVSLVQEDVCEFEFNVMSLVQTQAHLDELQFLLKKMRQKQTKTHLEFIQLRGMTSEMKERRKQLQRAEHINTLALKQFQLILDAALCKQVVVPAFFEHAPPPKSTIQVKSAMADFQYKVKEDLVISAVTSKLTELQQNLLSKIHSTTSLRNFIMSSIPSAFLKQNLKENNFVFVNEEKMMLINQFMKNHIQNALLESVYRYLKRGSPIVNQFTISEFGEILLQTIKTKGEFRNCFQNYQYLRLGQFVIYSDQIRVMNEVQTEQQKNAENGEENLLVPKEEIKEEVKEEAKVEIKEETKGEEKETIQKLEQMEAIREGELINEVIFMEMKITEKEKQMEEVINE